MSSQPEPVAAPAAHTGSFPTTHWSVVLNANAESATASRAALETLCRQYWYPIYSYVRRTGRPHHEAEDCTQEFFARLLASEGIARADPQRGRFRSFLLTALRHFLTDEWAKAQTAKRGGGRVPLSLDFATAEERFRLEPADPALTPDQAFDRSWARGLVDRVLADLSDEYARSGRGPLFTALAPLLWERPTTEALAERAAQLAMTVHALTMALHRLRRRLGDCLRDAVAETVAEADEVDGELRHLIGALSSSPG